MFKKFFGLFSALASWLWRSTKRAALANEVPVPDNTDAPEEQLPPHWGSGRFWTRRSSVKRRLGHRRRAALNARRKKVNPPRRRAG